MKDTLSIKVFGVLAEKTGAAEVSIAHCEDTEALRTRLSQQFPTLKDVQYSIAVDRKIAHSNVRLTRAVEVALLPPFSGG